METTIIKIEDRNYKVRFGYGATVYLGKLWGVEGVLDVFQRAIDIIMEGQDAKKVDIDGLDNEVVASSLMKFENIETIAEIITAGILCGQNMDQVPFDLERVRDFILQDIEVATKAFMAFIMAMPRPKGDTAKKKKPQPRKNKPK